MLQINRVIETVLYVDDLARASEFYRDTLQVGLMGESDTFCAFAVGDSSVLLLFERGASLRTRHLPGGEIPPHDGQGPLHVCFAIDAERIDAWEEHLDRLAVPIEGRMQWPRGGTSLYFRDPDQNLLELLTPGCWPIY
ncbi:VOC family protein [Pseudomonas sp. MBLB4123]|uniref:VOC family protein n=1 Tax=Pseudomonas sp. MBLB4123 TaxID=3451557 RepID=UPI003F75672E